MKKVLMKDSLLWDNATMKGRGRKKTIFLGKSPKLWVGGGQES